jgi:hypothetical protein
MNTKLCFCSMPAFRTTISMGVPTQKDNQPMIADQSNWEAHSIPMIVPGFHEILMDLVFSNSSGPTSWLEMIFPYEGQKRKMTDVRLRFRKLRMLMLNGTKSRDESDSMHEGYPERNIVLSRRKIQRHRLRRKKPRFSGCSFYLGADWINIWIAT